jgi:hypothetical protein
MREGSGALEGAGTAERVSLRFYEPPPDEGIAEASSAIDAAISQ